MTKLLYFSNDLFDIDFKNENFYHSNVNIIFSIFF